MKQYEVIVSNVGLIHSGTQEHMAYRVYNDAVWRSREVNGRMSGESVTLMVDGKIQCESDGSLYLKI